MITIIILVSIALGFLYIGLKLLEKAKHLKATGKKAFGTVVKNNYQKSHNDNRGLYYPVIQFITKNNQTIIQQLNFGSNPPKNVGTKLQLLYNPDNPKEVQINSELHLTYFPWFFILTGSLIIILVCLELFDIINFTQAIINW